MTNEERYMIGHDTVIRQKLGIGTGDVLYQTTDGTWWKKYEGEELGTREEVRTLITK